MDDTTRRVTFSLDTVRDVVICDWLDQVKRSGGNISDEIRRALDAHLDGDRDDQAARIVKEIIDELRAMDWVLARSGGTSGGAVVDPVVRDNLAGIGG